MTENEVTKLKRNITFFNILLIIAIITGDICYIQSESLLIKAITSFGFLLLGSINLVYSIKIKSEHNRFSIMMVIGLFLAMLGDILLNIHFITGAIFFAVGHVFYFIAYTVLVKFKFTDFIPAGVLFVSSVMLTCAPIFNFKSGVMKAVCITYALVISFMVGKAISNYIRYKKSVHKVLLLGSILFFFSDLMLLFKVFSDAPAITSTLCLLSYYPAECLLAYSILHINIKK